ncbi:MAG TPA: glycosyltransferase family 4 protein [Planctomycetota bacterium]|nr:glycosyltransferase family 4 protein [Planctomycetota bacterium]
MKARKNNVTEPKHGVADDLIRQVSESVVARSAGTRRGRSRTGSPPPQNIPAPAAEKSPPGNTLTEVAPKSAPVEPPVMKAEPARSPEPQPAPAAPPASEAPVAQAQPEAKKPAEPPVLKVTPPVLEEVMKGSGTKPVLAMFTYLEPDCAIGQYIAQTVPLLAARGTTVHLFARHRFDIQGEGIHQHELGLCEAGDILGSVEEFTLRALKAFEEEFKDGSTGVTVMSFEWCASRVLLELSRSKKAAVILSLHSLESQRSDLTSELSRKIFETELDAMRVASSILIHNGAVGTAATTRMPEVRERLIHVESAFPVQEFESKLDPGEVKGRFQIGPVDPTILYIGDFDDRHGPDLLMKAAAAILKNHKQARFVFVGDGTLQWPMRVHSRYLLLDYAVRFVGHLEGKPLQELVAACDVVCAPSRSKTEEWPVLAAWAAKRPLVTTHQMAGSFLQHEQDSVLCYANENSIVWGIERVLFDEGLRKRMGENGYKKVVENYGYNKVAGQLEQLMLLKRAEATAS